MLAGLIFLAFAGAASVATLAIVDALYTSGHRIGAALAGRPQMRSAPLATLVRAERRIAIRRWAAPGAIRLGTTGSLREVA